MTFDQIVDAVYEGISLSDLEALVSELASEKASELVGPNSTEYDELSEKFEEEFHEKLAAYWG
jgi:arsenate reductase-like glutaredoxin family protein